ncbi:hypothetical protein [Deinococcus planocerae]|uniref:hypothetical protein n=1 Tax=Deinococcus planocerae TaxID=1737569 RepID=UPI0011AEE071|nr:hypothetical protein [Deinococcus planocerae]
MTEPDRLEAVRQLYGRVVGLQLRIERTPQATPHIRQQVRAIAAPLEGLNRKLKGRSSSAQLDFIQARLLTIQQERRELFAQQLNPLMGSEAES